MIWVVLSVVGMVLVYFVWGPHMPPGRDSDQARVQQYDNRVLGTVAVPVFIFVWVYLAYALTNWRVKASTPVDEVGDGPPLKGHRGFQAAWLAVTTMTVISLFVFGTVELDTNNGAGTGSGQVPIFTPTGYNTDVAKSKLLVVQVIGQQWRWTFRYPQYGGLETSQMVVPAGQEVQYTVTSLDVTHSFWAVNLGVKADANPGVNNVAFATAEQDRLGQHPVRRIVWPLARRDGHHRKRCEPSRLPDMGDQGKGDVSTADPVLAAVRQYLPSPVRRWLLRPRPGSAAQRTPAWSRLAQRDPVGGRDSWQWIRRHRQRLTGRVTLAGHPRRAPRDHGG